MDFPQYLYNWGANPRRKDVFFEMDRNMIGGIPQEQNLIRIYQKYRDNNSTIINSDGSKGIFPHFDVGNSGIVCSNVQICGNWGGGGDNVGTCDYNIGYREKFSIIRKGLFHYALGCAGAGGGQSPSTYTDLFGYGVYGDYDGIDNFLHESGHNNGLPDGGTESAGIYNYKPHYTSVMNYAYCHGFDGSVANVHYSNGQYTKILNSTRLCESEGIGTTTRPTFLENSCFKYKVNDNGGVDWNRDGVIKNCIDPQCDDLVADGCVRAYINFCDSSTDALRYRQNLSWNNGIKTSYRPELVAFNGSLYMFIRKYLPGYGDDSNITYYRFTGFSGCDAHGRTPCDNWEQIGTVPIELTNYGPVTASSTIVNGEFRLYVFFRGTNGQIYYRYMNSSGQWSNNSISIGGSTNYTEVGSVSYYRYGLMFIWVDTSNRIHFRIMDNTGVWGSDQVAKDSTGNDIYSYNVPSIAVNPYFVFIPPYGYIDVGIAHIIFAENNSDYKLKMMYYDSGTNRWYIGVNFGGGDINSDVWERFENSDMKVGFEWVGDETIENKGGRFYIIFRSKSDTNDGKNIVRYGFMMPDETGKWKWRQRSTGRQDNQWTYSYTGVSLKTYNNLGITGLVAAYVHYPDDKDNPSTIRFLPFANGIYDYDLKDSDDWAVMKRGICISIRSKIGDDSTFCLPKVTGIRYFKENEF